MKVKNDGDEASPFDAQAWQFDRRAGLPPLAALAVAEAVFERAGRRSGITVLEIGAGTGLIGRALCRLPVRYIGLDNSRAMLDVFRDRGAPAPPSDLLLADATEPWPLAPGTVDVVFGSRSWHWLEPDHAIQQALAVAAPSGVLLLIGRVVRDSMGPKAIIRARLHELMRDQGASPRRGERHARALLDGCAEAGGRLLPRAVVAQWRASISPKAVLESWRKKEGLAGRALDPKAKAELLDLLERWTKERFGNIEAAVESTEQYTLDGAALNPRGSS